MALFKRKNNKNVKKFLKTIQATAPEGVPMRVLLESFLTGSSVNLSIPGTTNAYKTYETQVTETYKKYNSRSDFGGPQTRAVIDLRTALIAGEGISISAPNDQTAEWIEKFLEDNHLQGEQFINAVKGSEMAGQSLMVFKSDLDVFGETYIKVMRIPYRPDTPYRVIYTDPMTQDRVSRIEVKREGRWELAQIGRFVYVRTGGDDSSTEGPTTKVGVVLTDIENYDRAVRDIRRLNHILARITPSFKTGSLQETEALQKWMNERQWKIGQAFMGTAEFSYETVGTGAHQNLIAELTTTIKNISGTTGVPVHWFGYVDLMSNRSTAESLYEMIKHATILERVSWAKGMYELILNAQEMHIDSGGTGVTYDPDFSVELPLIDFSNFLDKVRALSLAYSDQAISLGDYRNQLPGIDPLDTEKAVAAEQEAAVNTLANTRMAVDESEEEGV